MSELVKKPGQKWYGVVQNLETGEVTTLVGKNRASCEALVNESKNIRLIIVLRGTQFKAVSQERFSFVQSSAAAEIAEEMKAAS